MDCLLAAWTASSVFLLTHSRACSILTTDHVIPCYTPQCSQSSCIFCASPKTNLCPTIRGTQGQGVMPDGTSRFKDKDGNQIYHFMGCSTMSEYVDACFWFVGQHALAHRLTLHIDDTQVHGAGRNFVRQDCQGGAPGKGLSLWLRRFDGSRCRLEHVQGRIGSIRGRLWTGRRGE